MSSIKIKVLKDLGNYKPGQVVEVPVTKNGNPREVFWKRRIRDSSFDNCVEVLKERKPAKAASKAKTKVNSKTK